MIVIAKAQRNQRMVKNRDISVMANPIAIIELPGFCTVLHLA